MIPDAAVEAAAWVLYVEDHLWGEPWETADAALQEKYRTRAIVALEAALPHLLSHEREETRLAHVDAVVNAESLSKYEAAVQALRELADNAERDRDYVKVVDAAAIHSAIDGALRDPHTAKPNNWV